MLVRSKFRPKFKPRIYVRMKGKTRVLKIRVFDKRLKKYVFVDYKPALDKILQTSSVQKPIKRQIGVMRKIKFVSIFYT